MKLAPILAHYLYANKRLDLPGIGSFVLEIPSNFYDAENSKQRVISECIRFENDHAVKESPELIAFISSASGKMKALASADLSSHLELAQQFLNIGKPFLLEGIGSLSKVRPGEYSFVAADVPVEKLTDRSAKETVVASAPEEAFSSYEPLLPKKTVKLDWKKPALILFTLVGTGLAIWGGYTVYKRSSSNKEIADQSNTGSVATTLVTDSSAFAKKDSNTAASPAIPLGSYKFIFETANKTRAFARYKTLKTYQWDVQMETKDSVQFKLFVLLPAIASDTTRMLDSLTAFNGRRVYIEN